MGLAGDLEGLRELQAALLVATLSDEFLFVAQHDEGIAGLIPQPSHAHLGHVFQSGENLGRHQSLPRPALEDQKLSPYGIRDDHVRQTIPIDIRRHDRTLLGILRGRERVHGDRLFQRLTRDRIE